jgi:Flp pilus assembly protein TadD
MLFLFLLSFTLVLPARAAGTESPSPAPVQQDPDYQNGKQAFEAKNWKLALEHFSRALTRDPGNADIQNYLGYAHRQSGNLDAAFRHYGEALRLDPRHRGAHEYAGEAYLIADNLPKAEEHLAALDRLCFFSCEEFRDLKKAVETFKQRPKPQ